MSASAPYRWMVDFDGVLADLDKAMIDSCNKKFGSNYTVDEIDNWHWWSQQPQQFADYVWKQCYPDLDWTLEKVQPEDGAIEAICDLLTNLDGVAEEVIIVTARKPDSTKVAGKWLEKHLPGDVRVKLVGTAGYRKSQYCQMHRLNVVVDDHTDNLRTMNAYRQRLFLVDKAYNVKDVVTRIERVASLSEAVKTVAAEVAA